MTRWAAIGLIGIALFLIGGGVWVASATDASIDQDPKTVYVGPVIANQEIAIQVTLRNHSRTPIHVLGIARVCNTSGCHISETLPPIVPAQGKADIILVFRPYGSGRVIRSIPVFTDATGTSELEVRLIMDVSGDSRIPGPQKSGQLDRQGDSVTGA